MLRIESQEYPPNEKLEITVKGSQSQNASLFKRSTAAQRRLSQIDGKNGVEEQTDTVHLVFIVEPLTVTVMNQNQVMKKQGSSLLFSL